MQQWVLMSYLLSLCETAAITWTGAQHDETVKAVAEKLGKNPAAVLVRWAIQHGTSGEHTVKDT